MPESQVLSRFRPGENARSHLMILTASLEFIPRPLPDVAFTRLLTATCSLEIVMKFVVFNGECQMMPLLITTGQCRRFSVPNGHLGWRSISASDGACLILPSTLPLLASLRLPSLPLVPYDGLLATHLVAAPRSTLCRRSLKHPLPF